MTMRLLSALTAAALMGMVSLPAMAQETTETEPQTEPQATTELTAETDVFPSETITGVEKFYMPTPPVGPIYFNLPMDIQVVKDDSVTTDTPITDQYGSDLPKWIELVRGCLINEKPDLVRVVEEEQAPFIINGTPGRIKLNANDKPVCPVS